MQASNFGGSFTNFSFEFFYKIFTEDVSLRFLYHGAKKSKMTKNSNQRGSCPRPAGSDPEVVCQKDSFLKVSVSLGGFGPSVAHGKHSVRRRCVQATKKQGRNLLSP